MAWLRLDDGFTENPKISLLTNREFRVWLRLLCYCARQQDPTIDRATRKNLNGFTPKFEQKLIEIALIDRVGDVYEIHDWIKYQPKDKTGADRQARWRSKRLEQADTGALHSVTAPLRGVSQEPLRDRYEDRYADRYENVTSRDARSRPVVLKTAPSVPVVQYAASQDERAEERPDGGTDELETKETKTHETQSGLTTISHTIADSIAALHALAGSGDAPADDFGAWVASLPEPDEEEL